MTTQIEGAKKGRKGITPYGLVDIYGMGGLTLRARAKITSHFAISASARICPTPYSQNLDIACYACDFAQSDRPNPNQIRAPILYSYFCANP